MIRKPRALPVSDHFDGHRFFNPGIDTDRSLADLWRWRRTQQRVAWPKHIDNPAVIPMPSHLGPGQIAFTFIGHSTYLIRLSGVTILTDPVFSDRASPLAFAGPKRVRAPGLALSDLPPVDLILLSHNHYDHMDLASLRALNARSSPTIVTGLGNGSYLSRKGIDHVVECDWWSHAQIELGVSVTYVPAQHWSSRTMFDRRTMLWGGHVVETPAGRIYFAGDTGAFDGFSAIRDRLGPIDVAILPIGAYEPRWFMKPQHMNPAEAVAAHRTLASRLSLAAHWGTFQLTDEGIDAPIEALAEAKRDAGLADDAFVAPLPGETILWSHAPAEGEVSFPLGQNLG